VRLKSFAAVAATLSLLVFVACGGGNDVATSNGSGGGIGGSGNRIEVSHGTIGRLGSIWVNHVKFSTVGATILIDGQVAAESDLRVGMVVRVDGSISGATASKVSVAPPLSGRVEQVIDANRMVVMGQTVRIDNLTRFENSVVPVVGDFVEVHGLPVWGDVVAAGFIEKKATLPSPSFATMGFVKSHDVVGQTFVVGTTKVIYAGATISDLPAGLWNGILVGVKGNACSGNPICDTLTASKVEPSGLIGSDIADVAAEGFVGSLSGNGFVVGAQRVVITASTQFVGGEPGDIELGSKLQVEGEITSGVLTASKVSLLNNIRLEADLAGVDPTGATLTLAGLSGVTVSSNSLTRFKGGIASLSELSVPNHVRIRGRWLAASNTVIATELELRSSASDSRVILQGPVDALVNPNGVTILGIFVNTAGFTDDDFLGAYNSHIGRDAFFNAVSTDTLVKASGSVSGGSSVDWTEAKVED